MRDTDYGLKVGQAYKAIARMHGDIRKLLVDCDNYLKENTPIFETTVTSDLSYSINASWWFASVVFRFWDIKKDYVLGATVLLYAEGKIDEPIIVLGKIKYKNQEGANLKSICYRWDLWNAYLYWGAEQKLGAIVRIESPDLNEDRIEWVMYIALSLFSIESFEDIKSLFEQLQVGETSL